MRKRNLFAKDQLYIGSDKALGSVLPENAEISTHSGLKARLEPLADNKHGVLLRQGDIGHAIVLNSPVRDLAIYARDTIVIHTCNDTPPPIPTH